MVNYNINGDVKCECYESRKNNQYYLCWNKSSITLGAKGGQIDNQHGNLVIYKNLQRL